MKFRWTFDYRAMMAVICAAVFTFCLLKYFQPVEAIQYYISGILNIPSIRLTSDVATIDLKDGKLDTPTDIVGSYSRHKNSTLLIAHSSTAFSNLTDIVIGDSIEYNGNIYNIYKSQIIEKSAIDMKTLLAEKENDTIILMTCYGQMYADGDASHRLIIFASRV